jgi:hypothetical protein
MGFLLVVGFITGHAGAAVYQGVMPGMTSSGWFTHGGLAPTSSAEAGLYSPPFDWPLTAEAHEVRATPYGPQVFPYSSAGVMEGCPTLYGEPPATICGWLKPDPEHPGPRGRAYAHSVRRYDNTFSLRIKADLLGAGGAYAVADAEAFNLGKFHNLAPANTPVQMKLNVSLHGLLEVEGSPGGPDGQGYLGASVTVYASSKAFESKPRDTKIYPIESEMLSNFLGPIPGEPAAYLREVGFTEVSINPTGLYETQPGSIEWISEGGEIYYVRTTMKGRLSGLTGKIRADNTLSVSFEDQTYVGYMEIPEPATISLLAVAGLGLLRRRRTFQFQGRDAASRSK